MFEKIVKYLKENLDEEKFRHSLGARDMAIKLADRFHVDKEKAALAALLHDCAKGFSYDKLLEIVKENNLDIPKEELECMKVLHAPVGAFVAQKEFGIEDGDILNAIKNHTMGRINMSDLEKVVFLSDKTEINTREKSLTDGINAELDKNNSMDDAVFYCIKMTIKSLIDRNLPVNCATIEIYNAGLKEARQLGS
ncbi:MAG: bis(5'-nucleosyl)-tetraphosphatase (symmetrical) YqeK [Candidatus Gastranaerophilales bacterium]|nr:bis(5'-nucleosyl)-tetraphosphatase (symmetrical) YqeK [Candidatus Gastranaerophilales bacterium]